MQPFVDLNGDETAAAIRQLAGQDSPAGADLDDEIAPGYGGLGNQASGENPAPQEVLR